MTPRPTHFPGLDGLRGLAILAVIAHNLQLLDSPNSALGAAVEIVLDRGWVGVQLFFVLSGFLITGILLDTRHALNHFRSFYARRALRIFPLYYVALTVLLVGLPWLGVPHAGHPTLVQQLPFWFYVSNWTQAHAYDGASVSHFWSLAVEEQFYLLWPFLLHRCRPTAVLRVCIAVAVLAFVARVVLLHLDVDPHAIYMASVARMDALALGGALAAALRVPRAAAWLAPRSGTLLLVAVGMGACGAVVTHGYPRLSMLDESFGYAVLSIALTALVGASVTADGAGRGGPLGWLRAAPLRAVGKYSYAMYVLHRPLNDLLGVPWLVPRLPQPTTSVLATVVYLGLLTLVTFLLAMLSHRWIERPFLRLKDRHRAEPPPSAGPDAPALRGAHS